MSPAAANLWSAFSFFSDLVVSATAEGAWTAADTAARPYAAAVMGAADDVFLVCPTPGFKVWATFDRSVAFLYVVD